MKRLDNIERHMQRLDKIVRHITKNRQHLRPEATYAVFGAADPGEGGADQRGDPDNYYRLDKPDPTVWWRINNLLTVIK